MAKINLRDYYPSAYKTDCFMEVSGEIAGAMEEAEREDHAYYERRRYHKAYYSLNAGDGIENEVVHTAPSPEEIFINRLTRDQLSDALAALPETQRRRIKAYFIHGMSKADIARAEGISEKNVRQSIERGLLNLHQHLKNYF